MKKFFSAVTRLLVLWVLAAVGVGYLYPPLLTAFKSFNEWFFSITMFGIGAVLSWDDFRPIVKKPQWVLVGTATQFAVMPALGFLIAKALRLPPEQALGMIMVGAVPGAMASNVISYLAGADVAYSVALTTTSTFLSPILTPTFVYFFGRTFIDVPFLPMFLSILKMVILPLLFGMLMRQAFQKKLEAVVEVFPALSTLFIAFICGLVVALNRDQLAEIRPMIFAAVVLHNLFGMAAGYGAGRLFGFDMKRKRTLAFEVGMQNAGLGAVLTLKHFSAQSALPNAFFATWCIVTASVLAKLWGKRKGSPKEE